MPSTRVPKIAATDITPERFFLNRRSFIAAAAGSLALGPPGASRAATLEASASKFTLDEALTPEKDATTYNNFYEFGTGKGDPAANSANFKPAPWTMKSTVWSASRGNSVWKNFWPSLSRSASTECAASRRGRW